MDEKTLSLDLTVKCANLCRFLRDEKGEHLLSDKLFSSISRFSECCYSIKNPALGKAEIVLLKKEASLEADKTALYLSALNSSGFISVAQKDSILQTFTTLKKEINL